MSRLTKVYLDGTLGDEFGHEWELAASSPKDALRIIDANKPGVMRWIRGHAKKYTHYQVVVEFENGESKALRTEDYLKCDGAVTIRFVPILEGSGKWTQAIIGVVMIVYGAYTGNSEMVARGAAMLLGGVISALLTRTSNRRLSTGEKHDARVLVSDVFDGPQNTVEQGHPVQLIYGRLLVGSQIVSASVAVNQTGAA